MIVHKPIILIFLSLVCGGSGLLGICRLNSLKSSSQSKNVGLHNAGLHRKPEQISRLTAPCRLQSSKADVREEPNIRGKAAFTLAALVVQNSALALLMRLSRVTTKSHSSMYVVSTAVVLSEFIKVLVSLLGFYCVDAGKDIKVMGEKIRSSSKARDLLKISIPAAMYVLQNNLQYVAMSNLPAEVYQVLIQGKIITTALFSVLLLNKRYSLMQWSSVVALSLGVALVQFSLGTSIVAASNVNFAIGITSVLISTLTSGFASIFLEKMLKTKGGFWIRNVQLSIISFLIAALGCSVKDSSAILSRGFFIGYNPLVLSVILTQALGGMLVAFVVRYTNSIVKGFAASGSIVLSCLVSAIFLSDYKLNRMFSLGTAMVCASALAWAVSPPPTVGKVDVLNDVGLKDIVASVDDVINNEIVTSVESSMTSMEIDALSVVVVAVVENDDLVSASGEYINVVTTASPKII